MATTIVIGPLPRLLGELVARLVSTERVTLADDAHTTDALVAAAVHAGATHVIAALASPDAARRVSCALGTRLPGVALVTLATDGRRAESWRDGACERALDDVSASALQTLLVE